MSDIFDIIKRNHATYRNYETGEPVGRAGTITLYALTALAVAIICARPSNDFLTGALSALAILVGFSFNVLFYLVANRLAKPASFRSIEHEKKFSRLVILADEVFDSTAYFSVIATVSIIVSLILLLSNTESASINIKSLLSYKVHGYALLPGSRWLLIVLAEIVMASALYLSMLESISTFLRTVQRVRFYFTMLKTISD